MVGVTCCQNGVIVKVYIKRGQPRKLMRSLGARNFSCFKTPAPTASTTNYNINYLYDVPDFVKAPTKQRFSFFYLTALSSPSAVQVAVIRGGDRGS